MIAFFTLASIFFLMLFLALFFSTKNKKIDQSALSIAPPLTADDMQGKDGSLDSIVSGLRSKAQNKFFSNENAGKIDILAIKISDLEKSILKIETQMLVYKIVTGVLAVTLGIAAAYLRIRASLPG